MDCSEFLLRSVVCGASVAATREGAEGPRGACVIQVIRSAVYLLLKFWVFNKEIEGRENR